MSDNKISFFIELKQKGIEFVKKYKKEIKELGDTSQKTSRNNDILNKSFNKTSIEATKTSKNIKELNNNLDKTNKSASNVGRNLGIAIGVATTALTAYSKKLINTVDAQSKLSQKSGVIYEEFQAYAELAKLSGVEVNSLANGFFELNKTIQDANLGEGRGLKYLEALNIDIEKLATLSPEKQLRLISEELKGLPELDKKLVLDKLRIKDLELLINNIEQVDEISKNLKENGLLISSEEAANFEKFNDDIAILFSKIDNFAIKFLTEIIPTLNEFLNDSSAGDDSFFNGDNAKDLAKSFLKMIAILNYMTKVTSVVKSGLEGVTTILTYFLFSLGEETEFALKKLVVNFDRYATLIEKGKWSGVFNNISKSLVDFTIDIDETFAKVKGSAGLFFAFAGQEKLAKSFLKQSLELTKNAELKKELITVDENLLEAENRIADEKIKLLKKEQEERKKAVDNKFEEQLNKSNAKIEESKKQEREARDFLNKMNSDLDKKDIKKIEDKAKPVVKSLKDRINENIKKNEIDLTGFKTTNSYKKLLSNFEEQEQIIDLKLMLNPESKDQYVNELKKIFKEEEEIISVFGTENDLLKKQLENKIKIKKLTEEINKSESLNKEILSAQLQLLRLNNNELEALEIERLESIKDINKEFGNIEDKAILIDLTNKIFDIEKFRENLSIVEKELEELNNKLLNTDFFDFNKRNELENQINNKTKERIDLQEKLGEKQEEVNEGYIFTVERINKLNEELKDSFIDIFSEFASGTLSAKEAFNSFATFFLKKISEMILEQMYLNTIGKLGANGSGATGGLGSLFMGAMSSIPFFHTGGTVGVTQPLMQVPGITKNDESLAVLKKGEQVLTKNQQFNNGNNKGSNNIVENNIIIDSDSLAKSTLESQNGIDGVLKILRKNKDQIKNILD